MLGPIPGSYVQCYYAPPASTAAYSNEAMQEVDLTPTYPRYTVYRITAAAKRCIYDSAVPTFELQTHGSGGWAATTPTDIWYPAGYIIFSDAKNNDDVIRCATGNYLTPTLIFGAASRTMNSTSTMDDVTCFGDTAIARYPIIDDWKAKVDVFIAKNQASYTSSGGATNSNWTITHLPGGATIGNDCSIELVAPSDEVLSVAVTTHATVVNLAKATSITTTAKLLVAALNANTDFRALDLIANIAPGQDGSGIVAVLGHTHLTGGLDIIDYDALKGLKMIFRWYTNTNTTDMWSGYGFIEQVDFVGKPTDHHKASLTISGSQYPSYHTIG